MRQLRLKQKAKHSGMRSQSTKFGVARLLESEGRKHRKEDVQMENSKSKYEVCSNPELIPDLQMQRETAGESMENKLEGGNFG